MTFPNHTPSVPASELGAVVWHKSSYSGAENACVEYAMLVSGQRAVRDSKDPDRGTLLFAPDAWRRFIDDATR